MNRINICRKYKDLRVIEHDRDILQAQNPLWNIGISVTEKKNGKKVYEFNFIKLRKG
jgi:hypothetical protein